jgi:hypothetical protein
MRMIHVGPGRREGVEEGCADRKKGGTLMEEETEVKPV